jgi:Icc-related predicted phosphoesterase
MKILAVSDFHGSVKASERAVLKAKDINADVIVVCGDITHFGSPEDAEEVLSPLTALKLPVLFVPGNCDPHSLLDAKIEGANCIHGKCEIYGGVSFIGAASLPLDRVHPSPWEISEEEILEALNEGSKQCTSRQRLVVVAHSPPINTKLDLAYAGHVGSPSLRLFIEQKQPSVVFCGHIHEARGIDYIGETLIVNTGPVRHGHCALGVFNEKVEVQLSLCE